MFDPSFFELIVICIVALLVLGPDRLPGAIKTCGLWIGRLRRSFNKIKREIEQEVGADEIRRQLRNEDIMEKFKNTKTQITESIDSVKKEAESVKDGLDLKKQLSEFTDGESASEDNPASENFNPENITGQNREAAKISSEHAETETDPVEKLATNDPTVTKATAGNSGEPESEPASSQDSEQQDK